MLDSDLAKLYETDTKKLKQQVRRNIDRFPEDFIFELSESEKKQLLFQESRLSNPRYTCIATNFCWAEAKPGIPESPSSIRGIPQEKARKPG